MKRQDWVDRISDKTGISKVQAKAMLDAYVEVVTEDLKEHGRVRLYAMGVLEAVQRRARVGLNVVTREKVAIAARRVVRFRAGKTLRELMGN